MAQYYISVILFVLFVALVMGQITLLRRNDTYEFPGKIEREAEKWLDQTR